jgi:hypothetical protein
VTPLSRHFIQPAPSLTDAPSLSVGIGRRDGGKFPAAGNFSVFGRKWDQKRVAIVPTPISGAAKLDI